MTGKTTEAFKLAEEALEELHYSSGTVKAVTLYKSALAAIREALAGQGKQEPVSEHDLHDVRCECCGYMTHHREHMGCIRAAYAAPVSAEAIRAEALEEAAKVCRTAQAQGLQSIREAIEEAIRGLK